MRQLQHSHNNLLLASSEITINAKKKKSSRHTNAGTTTKYRYLQTHYPHTQPSRHVNIHTHKHPLTSTPHTLPIPHTRMSGEKVGCDIPVWLVRLDPVRARCTRPGHPGLVMYPPGSYGVPAPGLKVHPPHSSGQPFRPDKHHRVMSLPCHPRLRSTTAASTWTDQVLPRLVANDLAAGLVSNPSAPPSATVWPGI